MHWTGLGFFYTIGYPPNWLFTRAHDNVASVHTETVGENCIVNRANRLTDEESKYGAKKQRKMIGGGCRKDIPRNSGQQPKCSEGVGPTV